MRRQHDAGEEAEQGEVGHHPPVGCDADELRQREGGVAGLRLQPARREVQVEHVVRGHDLAHELSGRPSDVRAQEPGQLLVETHSTASGPDGAAVEAWPYRLMPEYGPEGAVMPPPSKGNEVRVAGVKVASQTPAIRSGQRIIFVTLDDLTGPIDVTLFERVQAWCARTVFHSWLLLMRGEVRKRGGASRLYQTDPANVGLTVVIEEAWTETIEHPASIPEPTSWWPSADRARSTPPRSLGSVIDAPARPQLPPKALLKPRDRRWRP